MLTNVAAGFSRHDTCAIRMVSRLHFARSMHLKLIYNPAAGRGRTRKHEAEVEAALRARGAEVETYASRSAADLTRAAAEASRAGYDRVVICGGDGTVHFALRDFDLARGTMAVVPLGSGDDFAHVIGVPDSIEDACDVAVGGQVRSVDVATANGVRYLGVAGLGFDSEVAAANRNVRFLRGSAVYFYAILRVLPRFRPHAVRIRSDDGWRNDTIMFAAVGNSRQYGGGIRIVPTASIDDGTLDVCIVHRTSRVQLLRTLPLAYSGAHVKRPYVELARGSEFHFESERPMEVYADGEPVTWTPVTFAIAAEKLRVMAPRVTR